MTRAILILTLMLALLNLPKVAESQDFSSIFQDFDASLLSQSDKRFLQAALAFEGHYNGLLDGKWGAISRRSFTNYSRAEFNTGPEDWHIAMLAWSFFTLAERDGWEIRSLSNLGVSMLWPSNQLITDPRSESFENYRVQGSSLAISLGRQSVSAAQRTHDFVLNSHGQSPEPYVLRKPDLAITGVKTSNGGALYGRSNFVNGAWSTVLLSADRADTPTLNAMASSIAVGRPEPLHFAPGGHLDSTIRNVTAFLEREEAKEAETTARSSVSSPASPPSQNRTGSGSGFVVSAAGHVLTNAHVVEGCRNVFVDGFKAGVVEISNEFDLAVLKTEEMTSKQVAVFSADSAKLNSDVTAVGFPYAGLLGGVNVTRGSVSSLKGMQGDSSTMQITSPVQSGNSGGPLLASDGEVVGVVVAKMDAVKAAELLGDVPQNVNFAIRGEIARLFLSQNGINPKLSLDDVWLEPEELATTAQGFTVFIECK